MLLFGAMLSQLCIVFQVDNSALDSFSNCSEHHHESHCEIELYHPELDVDCGHESHLRSELVKLTDQDKYVFNAVTLSTKLWRDASELVEIINPMAQQYVLRMDVGCTKSRAPPKSFV